jgi:heptosyltransferase-3
MVEDPVPLSELRRALVIKLRHHGDVLLTSPLFKALKNHAPQLEIDALVYADTAPMLTLHPAITEVHRIDRNWKRSGLLRQGHAEWGLLRTLRRRGYDFVIHLTEHRRGAWLTRTLRPRFAVAPKLAAGSRFWRSSFTHLYGQPMNARRHTVERNLDALRSIGLYPDETERRLVLVPGHEAQARVALLLEQHELAGEEFVHIHPSSRWLFKCWPAEKLAQLIMRLQAAGHRIVLTSAPDARERRYIDDITARLTSPTVSLAGELTLKELAALTAQARVFIGVDSAPMHIAAAMQTPTVALFGPSGELEWRPWQVAHLVVSSDYHPCRPCGLDGCGGGKVSECLTTLPVERVLEAVYDLLREP